MGLLLAISACVQILGDDFEISDAGPDPDPGDCGSEPTCSACDICANEGPCRQARDACEQNQECVDFLECIGQCDGNPDPQCVPNCDNDYPEPMRIMAEEWWRCVHCDHCVGPCGTGPQC